MDKVTKKILSSKKCYKCNGNGYIEIRKKLDLSYSTIQVIIKKCNQCEGIGKYEDYQYLFTDGKIAINGDTLK